MQSTLITTIALGLNLLSSASANIVFFDDFGTAPGTTELQGRTPVTTPGNDWLAFNSNSTNGWKIQNGEALFLPTGTVNAMAGIDLGANYFSSNPGVYSLKSTFSMTADSESTLWYGLGYSEFISQGQNRGFYETSVSNEGKPWMFMRQNGELNVRVAGNSSVYSQTGYDVSSFEMELVLDTTPTNWTVDAFYNGTQLDLNGASIGMSYTYSTNPTLAAVGLSAPDGVIGTVQSITLQTVPEPSTYALLLGLFSLGVMVTRRRR